MTATGFAAGAALAKNGAGDADWVQAQQNGQAVRTAPGFAVGGCIGEKNGAGDANWVQAQPGDRFQ
ncbi:hypothetical protein DWY99_04655 [[Clostridium] leptum]|uniref:Uncharacterized protein n=1 Tax=[Clostridium] leptum TaxID=1535 RepID=A0A412AZ01_9FIRM|nr:hypothetical protein DWY99_04655 [[Clostridium] leptum]